jgi:predicted phage-related endonuclease
MSIATPIDRTADVTAFSSAAEWTGVRDEDRSAWLALRKTMLTAGDLAAVMGEDDKRSALDVYIDKVVGREDGPMGLDDPRLWGKVLEQPILSFVAKYYGWKYRQGGYLLRSRKHPHVGCTLDAEVDREDGRGWIPFEGKTTDLPRDWDEESGQLPIRVLIQVQHQLLVTGAPCAFVFALIQRKRPVEIPIQPSPEFHEILVEQSRIFMELVRTGTLPTPTGTEAFGRALQRFYPVANGKAVALPPEAADWTRAYQEVSEQIKQLENRKAYFAQLLKTTIGPATYGVLPQEVGGKRAWRWSANKGAETRSLIALKLPPVGARNPATLPKAGDVLTSALAHSIEDCADDGTAPLVRP